MRYRRLGYRYTMVIATRPSWWPPLGDFWQSDRLRSLAEVRWRPDADVWETASGVEVVVDLAGVDEDDFEVQLFEDALVVEGQRSLPACEEAAVYHAASIRHGPFRVDVRLPAPVDPEHVVARYERGLLRITLPKLPELR